MNDIQKCISFSAYILLRYSMVVFKNKKKVVFIILMFKQIC